MNVYDPFDFPYNTGPFTSWAPQLLTKTFNLPVHDPLFDFSIYDDIVHTSPFNIEGSVIIVGGGPSSLSLTNADYESYDFTWTMNYGFRLVPDVDLLAVGGGIDIEGAEFNKWLNNNKRVVLAFEIHPRFFGRNIRGKFPDAIFFHNSVYGKIGVGVRLVNLAANLGAHTIAFIGFDGPQSILEGRHAFQMGKTELPSGVTPSNADDVHSKQYSFFWNFIRQRYPDTKFVSLDTTNPYHKCLNQ